MLRNPRVETLHLWHPRVVFAMKEHDACIDGQDVRTTRRYLAQPDVEQETPNPERS